MALLKSHWKVLASIDFTTIKEAVYQNIPDFPARVLDIIASQIWRCCNGRLIGLQLEP